MTLLPGSARGPAAVRQWSGSGPVPKFETGLTSM